MEGGSGSGGRGGEASAVASAPPHPSLHSPPLPHSLTFRLKKGPNTQQHVKRARLGVDGGDAGEKVGEAATHVAGEEDAGLRW